MRIRYKKWARPELEASKFYEDEPEKWKGKWKEHFNNPNQPFMLELENSETNYLAIDLVDAMLGLAKRNIEQSYNEAKLEPNNVMITRFDIERINLILSREDNVRRIYINFCNPWPKGKHRKKRLTHTRQLEKYKEFLSENGESSLGYFEEAGFEILNKTYDLHNEPIFERNIETEHEKMFSEQGIKIKALIARLK